MVRAAAVNFMGRSSDSPFWDISSSNLIKNAIVYCAAEHGYFTLLDLYRAIVRASKENLSDDLRKRLETGAFYIDISRKQKNLEDRMKNMH